MGLLELLKNTDMVEGVVDHVVSLMSSEMDSFVGEILQGGFGQERGCLF